MVYVSQTQMEEIDFLLTESGRGFHLLFDNDVIKKFLSRNINEEELFNDEKLPEIEQLLEDFISTPSMKIS